MRPEISGGTAVERFFCLKPQAELDPIGFECSSRRIVGKMKPPIADELGYVFFFR